MVQNIINLSEREDKILNIVKAKFSLKNKSQAVAMVIRIYEQSFLEPELRPEYSEKIDKIKKEKYHNFSSADELAKATK